MGKDDIESFDTSGTAAEVNLRWKKRIRSFNYFVAAGDITNNTRLKNLLLHKAGLAVQDIFDDLQDPLPVDQRPSSDYEPNPTFERHLFRQMSLLSGETRTQYATRLRQQANFMMQ